MIKLDLKPATPDENAKFDQVKDDVEKRIAILKKRDAVHKTTVAAKVDIKQFKLLSYAVHNVSYGTIHFGKVDVGGMSVHVRIHQFHNGQCEFHSIDTTMNSCTWVRRINLEN
jgi:hypothetical protein